jgi:hypothetical protein
VNLVAVITTVHPPTEAVRRLATRLADVGAPLVIVGDAKGPESYDVAGTRLLTLQDQLDGKFALARTLPIGHYSRKNIGYLAAIATGAEVVYETDDDNAPTAAWRVREPRMEAAVVDAGQAPLWVNAYAYFTHRRVWPRGFPLERVHDGSPPLGVIAPMDTAVQQGLCDGAPDVDAVWRLVIGDKIAFDSRTAVVLPRGCWCPFNSQNTWWFREAFPLLYLPSRCSFRMTDIWRSLIAQRCLWAAGSSVGFHAADVVQDRNPHDLLRDFAEEVPGYLTNSRIARVLDGLELREGTGTAAENLPRCYEGLVQEGILPAGELMLVEAWLADLDGLGSPS